MPDNRHHANKQTLNQTTNLREMKLSEEFALKRKERTKKGESNLVKGENNLVEGENNLLKGENNLSRRGAVVDGVEQICKSTSEWRRFDSRWFYQSGFEFAKTPLLIDS